MNLNTVLWPSKKIVYLAIGKTASTSVKRAIAVEMGRPVPEGESPHFSPNLDYTNNVMEIRKLLDDGWMSLVVERNPIDRFVSWYRDKINRPEGVSKYAKEYGFEVGPLDQCVTRLVTKIPNMVKDDMETHLAPQRYLQSRILSGRTPNIRIPFSNVGPALQSLFGLTIGKHNTSVCLPMKISGHTYERLNAYYYGDRDCLK